MKNRKMHVLALCSVVLVFSLILPASAGGASVTMTLPEESSTGHLMLDNASAVLPMALNTPTGNVTPMVAAGYYHTVGLKSDGTVVAVGSNEHEQCNVGSWTDIIQVAAGGSHTVGLKSWGTVLAAGDNSYGQCDVGDWRDITRVAAGDSHTVGLKSDGTVVATINNVSDWKDITQVAAGHGHTVGLKSDGTVVAVGASWSGRCDSWTDITQVAAGHGHAIGLKSDGTVVAVGVANDYGQCEVGGWRYIIQVAAGGCHTVGLESDGTVVAVGRNADHKQCEVGDWTDIVQVSAGWQHTVGLKNDGTLVAVGYKYYGQCNVSGWTDITQIAAGDYHTVGLKTDGTAVAVGDNIWGECNVGNWTDITQVAAGDRYTVGLKFDGTVVAVGDNTYGQCNVGGWTDIVQVAIGSQHTVGLKSDGTVVATAYNVGGWADIIQVAAGGTHSHTVGLRTDGTVVAVGDNTDGQCEVGGWTEITQIAAGIHHTVGLKSDGTVVAAGPATLFAGWNLVLALPPPQRALTISSTRGGSVTTPGQGTFDYDRGTVVDLAAEPEEGYRFDKWTGDVNTIGNVTAAATNITMDGDYSIAANFMWVEAGDVGIKPGDWIKLAYNVTGLPAGQPYAEWLKFEFLSVNGTTADVRRTVHMSDGTEQSSSGSIDVVSGSEVPWLAGVAIPANRTTGDSVYIVGYGNVAVEGETTGAYAGADRTVVYTGFSQDETQVTYYWDKLTGVLVELSSTSPGISGTAKATETNMWGAAAVGMPWWPWIIVGVVVVVGVVVFFVRRRGRGPAPT